MKLIYIFFSILLSIQIIRIFYINIFEKDTINRYKNLQYFKKVNNVKKRGSIYDRNNKLLAYTKQSYSIYCSPSIFLSDNSLNFIKKYFQKAYEKIQESIINKNKLLFCYLKRNINEKELKEFKLQNFKDIFLINEFQRKYSCNFLSPIIGNVDIDLIGISGLEFLLENKIKHENNFKNINKLECLNLNENKKIINDIKITLDKDLSLMIFDLIHKCLKENFSESIYAIVLNPKNGDIISYSQAPILDDVGLNKPLFITDSHEMGSVMKSFLALSALNENKVLLYDIIDCKNSKSAYVDKLLVNTWKANGKITFKEVIQQSNNIGTAQIGITLGESFYKNYCKLGFGKKTNIELPGEANGFINHPNNWSKRSLISLSFGYEISATLLQLAVAWSVFTNKGKKISPRILLNTEIKESEELFSNDIIEKCREIFSYDKSRTPKRFHELLNNISIFAKTGTARIIENGEYQENKNIYTCIGHIENDKQKRIIAVFIKFSNKKNIYAVSIALPLFLEIANLLYVREYKI